MSSQQIAADWLSTDPAYRELALRIGGLVELQAMMSASYPELRVDVLSLEGGTLAVAARNAALAARLRQLEPSVVGALRRRGAAVERLRIRTRLGHDAGAAATPSQPRPPIPQSALSALRDVGAQVEEGALRQAIERLLTHQTDQRKL
jgi:hypothetical protein